MGPRRQLEIAVKQVKEEMQQELSGGSVPHVQVKIDTESSSTILNVL